MLQQELYEASDSADPRDMVVATDSVRIGRDEPEEHGEGEHDERESTELQADGSLHPLTVKKLPEKLKTLFSKQTAQQFGAISRRGGQVLREHADGLGFSDARDQVIERSTRAKAFVQTFFAHLKRRRTTADEGGDVEREVTQKKVVLRKQRTAAIVGHSESAASETSPTKMRFAVAVALAGIGLAGWALAPHGPADQIALPDRIANAAPAAEPVVDDEPLALEIEPAVPAKPEPKKKKADAVALAAAEKPALDKVTKPVVEKVKPAPAPAVELPAFGEAEVPNGRMFTLRMNGPIASLEGTAFENGFTVKVPGRTPVDPARPIASAHRAVKRALFMNQGKYAELTIEFLPGFAPRYQVRAKGDALEITLERL